uniref:Uncharacterized protein n=1 Tax=Chromera velia CCMP2878 TaxID=1169474 RepID=A0A0K6S7I4_9ALVE|eukprot:Cvel_21804.t1-p1 / transcript=Cvel_21804.t1 / gene=Cvel_21804 / organism=Chromera_velia_CCMP2878 / gene_product=hypothetical protein / transcript_product=hypothetical protein / location=Cvel_scaffold2078:6878-7982(-) / protein_length=257 / sequence_SO=supercontig / SO=protein_coding / is_pseudo=false
MRPSWSLLGPLLRLLPLLSLFFSGQVRKADADSREYICEFVELGSVSGPILTEIPNDRFPELGNGNGMKISIYGNSIPPVIQHLDGIRPNPDDPFIPVNLLAEFTGTPRPLALTALWSSVPTEGFEVDINSTGNDPVRFITARPYKGWFEGPWWKVTRVQSGAALALEKGKETETKWGRKGRKVGPKWGRKGRPADEQRRNAPKIPPDKHRLLNLHRHHNRGRIRDLNRPRVLGVKIAQRGLGPHQIASGDGPREVS